VSALLAGPVELSGFDLAVVVFASIATFAVPVLAVVGIFFWYRRRRGEAPALPSRSVIAGIVAVVLFVVLLLALGDVGLAIG